ncbi:hypothetical protein BDV10DRAFT_143967 [Aspergillus recurvatus]
MFMLGELPDIFSLYYYPQLISFLTGFIILGHSIGARYQASYICWHICICHANSGFIELIPRMALVVSLGEQRLGINAVWNL